MEFNPVIDKYGNKRWYNEKGELHREGDDPAVIFGNGDKFWYKKSKRHREVGPAIEWTDGSKFWYKEDKCHRVDGAAIEYSDGTKEWYYEGDKLDCKSQEEFERILSEKGITLGKETTYVKQNKNDAICKICGKFVDSGDDSCWWCGCTNPTN